MPLKNSQTWTKIGSAQARASAARPRRPRGRPACPRSSRPGRRPPTGDEEEDAEDHQDDDHQHHCGGEEPPDEVSEHCSRPAAGRGPPEVFRWPASHAAPAFTCLSCRTAGVPGSASVLLQTEVDEVVLTAVVVGRVDVREVGGAPVDELLEDEGQVVRALHDLVVDLRGDLGLLRRRRASVTYVSNRPSIDLSLISAKLLLPLSRMYLLSHSGMPIALDGREVRTPAHDDDAVALLLHVRRGYR